MSLQIIFKCLENISKLGSPSWTTLEVARKVVAQVREHLSVSEGDVSTPPDQTQDVETAAKQRILTTLNCLMSDLQKENGEHDIRLECGCLAVALLYELLPKVQTQEKAKHSPHVSPSQSSRPSPSPQSAQPPSSQETSPSSQSSSEAPSTPSAAPTEKRQRSRDYPEAPPGLFSVQQTKSVEGCVRVWVYTIVVGCVGVESGRYLKTSLARTKFVLGPDLTAVPHNIAPPLLAHSIKMVIPVMKHKYLGTGIRDHLFPELLTILLELCFSPEYVKTRAEDTAFFRTQLEDIMTTTDSITILKHLLFLMGFAPGGTWLGRVCGSLMVRRYLTQPGGVAAVAGAGLAVCDGHDWRCCEAVAAIIAHAKTNDLQGFYSAIGPQVCELLEREKLKGEVLRVLVLTVTQLATRSSSLTTIHITSPLLQPLTQTTLPEAVSTCDGTNLTKCLSLVHRVFVEIPPPSLALTSLLQPVLCPLVATAALPTTHLRTPARHTIVRYLSQLSREKAVDGLLTMSSLAPSPESPAVHQNVVFSVDDAGGVAVNIRTKLQKDCVLEDDENLSKCIISMLELLKNSSVVLLFYERLTEYIDFTMFDKQTMPSNLLLTDEDIRDEHFDKMRRIVMSCSLLENLSESEPVTSDLFTNLSAAVPIVNALIRVGCQTCEEEEVQGIQATLLMNVLMLVSCYASDRTLKKRMGSEDWKGLRDLLPALEEAEGYTSDEAVLLLIDQLKNLVLTHGAVNVLPTVVPHTRKVKNTGPHNTIKDTKLDVNKIKKEMLVKETRFYEEEIDPDSTGKLKTKSKINAETNPMKSEVSSLKKKTLIEELSKESEHAKPINIKESKSTKSILNNESESMMGHPGSSPSSYQEAMEELLSPLLPVRGHALLALGKLLAGRDHEALNHGPQLLSIFQHNLKEDDSYLYLMAVEGLAVLCDIFPDKVVESLTTEFSMGGRRCDDRAKLAEVLVRATRRLGPLLPHYKNTFINALLNGVKAEESIVRAASLSALGDVCKLLRFSIGHDIYEIFSVLYNIVETDKAAEVRGAAVLVVTLLLQGLGEDAFTVLKDVLVVLNRALRRVQSTDPDSTVRLHAQVAREELDVITRRFLLPRLALTKRIYVTEIPKPGF